MRVYLIGGFTMVNVSEFPNELINELAFTAEEKRN